MNNTPGNAQRQGAESRRASTLNAISNPKPQFYCKHSNFWFAYHMRIMHMPKVNQKNRPFGLLADSHGGWWGKKFEPRWENGFLIEARWR